MSPGPSDIKNNWEEIVRPLAVALHRQMERGEGWFVCCLELMEAWADSELNKAIPQSPELAIEVCLGPLENDGFYDSLVRGVHPDQAKQIAQLKQHLRIMKENCQSPDCKWQRPHSRGRQRGPKK
jgi:hypothetical protein